MKRGLITLALLLWGVALARDGLDRWVAATELPVTLHDSSVTVVDRDGVLMRVFPVDDGLIRLAVTPQMVDPAYLQLLIRAEDKRFYGHAGVDPRALLRAGAQAVWHRRVISGGSTLTMQVARLLEDGSTGRWQGKLRQIRVALALERQLDKSRILELYLTHAPFGGPLEGVRAASLAWFGKEPGRLTADQSALLVALPQSPETRRPDRHPKRARAARDRLLQRDLGVYTPEAITLAQAQQVPQAMRPFPRLAPHLADHLRQTAPDRRRHDLTLDAGLQARIQHLTAQAAQSAGPRISAAVIVADHQSGAILASVGSPSYADQDARQGFVDMTRAIRSPGSTLKPLIYGLAFDQGLAHPETLIHDGPVSYDGYAPQNFDGRFRGDVRLRAALQMSLNIPVVKLTRDLGPARVMTALRRAGIDPQLPGGKPGLAIALGGIGLSLHDLVQLYAGLARGGEAVTLSAVAPAQAPGRILSDTAAWHLGDILQGLAPPPGAAPGLAYKTGTSYGHRDAWAIGWDGQHVIGVWMGRADGSPVPGAFGGDMAAPVLFRAFDLLKPDRDRLPPPPPAALITTTAQLPGPLQRYEKRQIQGARALKLLFPPDGAYLETDGQLVLKLRGGRAPFAVLVNGTPRIIGARDRQIMLSAPGQGAATVTVVDQQGQSDRIRLTLAPR